MAMSGGAAQMLYESDGNRVAKLMNGAVTRTYACGQQGSSEGHGS